MNNKTTDGTPSAEELQKQLDQQKAHIAELEARAEKAAALEAENKRLAEEKAAIERQTKYEAAERQLRAAMTRDEVQQVTASKEAYPVSSLPLTYHHLKHVVTTHAINQLKERGVDVKSRYWKTKINMYAESVGALTSEIRHPLKTYNQYYPRERKLYELASKVQGNAGRMQIKPAIVLDSYLEGWTPGRR